MSALCFEPLEWMCFLAADSQSACCSYVRELRASGVFSAVYDDGLNSATLDTNQTIARLVVQDKLLNRFIRYVDDVR